MYKYSPDYTNACNYKGYRECHIGGESDWLLIYKEQDDKLILVFTATGTHSDLFE